jgi:hypothetical protein
MMSIQKSELSISSLIDIEEFGIGCVELNNSNSSLWGVADARKALKAHKIIRGI